MKSKKSTTINMDNNQIVIHRYKQEVLEDYINKSHQDIVFNTAIPLAKDLAARDLPQLEADNEQVFCGVISGAYNKLMMYAKTELQTDIEEHHIALDKKNSNTALVELEGERAKAGNELRLKKREFEKTDGAKLVKKDKRYKNIRWLLIGMVFVDLAISSKALQSMGYNLIISYVVGVAIGISLFLVAEFLPELINKGENSFQKISIAGVAFIILTILFYVLGIFRTISFSGGTAIEEGAKPIYFACLNMFFVIVATMVSYFNKPSKEENEELDNWLVKKDEITTLEIKVANIKKQISETTEQLATSQLSRKQILLYARDIQKLIQQLYEEAFKTFMSTNLIHRSDGKIPKFFSNEVPKLNNFYKSLNLQQ